MANDALGSLSAQASSIARSSDLAQATKASAQARSGKVDDAIKHFEELLSTMLVREMRRGVDEGFFGGGAGADTFEGWLDEHLGRSLARDGVFDLAQAVRVSIGMKGPVEPSSAVATNTDTKDGADAKAQESR
jgi:Rod binding domain-containing protein